MSTKSGTYLLICFSTLVCISSIGVAQQKWKVYISDGTINSIAVNGDSIWLATEAGILLYNKSTGTTQPYSSEDGLARNKAQRSIAISRDGILACGGAYDGLNILHPGESRWEKYFATPDSLDFGEGPFVYGIAFDSQDNLWIADDWSTGSQFDYSKSKMILNTLCVAVDSNDNAWFGSYDKNIKRYDKYGNLTVYSTLNNNQGFRADKGIIVDRQNRVWAASDSDGIAVFDGSSWNVYDMSNSNLPSNDIERIGVAKNGIIAEVGNSALWKFDGTTWSLMQNLPFSFNDGWVTAMGWGNDGRLYVGFEPYGQTSPTFIYLPPLLFEFDGNSWTEDTIHAGYFPYGDAERIAIDKSGKIWAGVLLGGLLSFDGKVWQRYYPGDTTIMNSTGVSAIAVDKSNQVWIVTSDYSVAGRGGGYYYGGVSSFDGSKWTTWVANKNLSSGQPTFQDNSQIIFDFQNNMWIGGWTGDSYPVKYLYKFNGSEWEKTPVVGFSTFTIDSNGVIWYAHGDTLTSFDGSVSKDYPIGGGMNISSMNIAVGKDGSFWVTIGYMYNVYGPTWALAKFNAGVWSVYHPTYSNLRYETDYNPRIAVDQSNTVWVASGGSGLWSFDGTTWNNYNPYNSDIGCIYIADIAVDANNNKWLLAGNFENTVIEFNENGITAVNPRLSEHSLPKSLYLSQNYPNPFNPSTVIDYQVPTNTVVVLKVFDVLGREVETLVDERQSAGNHSVILNATNLPSGVYFYRLQAGTSTEIKKLMILK